MIKTIFTFLILLGLTMARRMPTPASDGPDMRKMGAYGWGYPYGWGVEVPMLDDTFEEHKTVKEVKSVEKESKKDRKNERLHSKHNPFTWGVNDHSDVEEIMDGFIE